MVNGRDLDGKAARLPNAALDGLGALAQMRVAGIDFAPGIDDGDDRLAGEVFALEAQLQHARAMAEAAQRVGAEPAETAEFFGFLFRCHCATSFERSFTRI